MKKASIQTQKILNEVIQAEYDYFSKQKEEFNFFILPWKLPYGVKANLNQDLVFDLMKNPKFHFLSDDLLHLNLSFPFKNGNKVIVFKISFNRRTTKSIFYAVKLKTYVIVKGKILQPNEKKSWNLRVDSEKFSINKISTIAFETIRKCLKSKKVGTKTMEVVDLIKKRTNHDVIALFLSGSKLNNLDTKDTHDTDYIAIVHDSATDILKNKIYSTQIKDTLSNNEEVDIKIYDTRQLFHLIEKSNFNLLETFNQYPIYNDNSVLAKEFEKENFVKNISTWNLNNLIRSCKGFVDSRFYQATKNKKELSAKDFIQAVKCERYVKQSFKKEKWDLDFHDKKVFTTKKYENKEITLFELKKKNDFSKYQKDFITYLQSISNYFEKSLEKVKQEKRNNSNLEKSFELELVSDLNKQGRKN